jgi:hypothetical protein
VNVITHAVLISPLSFIDTPEPIIATPSGRSRSGSRGVATAQLGAEADFEERLVRVIGSPKGATHKHSSKISRCFGAV